MNKENLKAVEARIADLENAIKHLKNLVKDAKTEDYINEDMISAYVDSTSNAMRNVVSSAKDLFEDKVTAYQFNLIDPTEKCKALANLQFLRKLTEVTPEKHHIVNISRDLQLETLNEVLAIVEHN